MEEISRLQQRIHALESQVARLRGESRRLWTVRDRLWDLIEPHIHMGTWTWEVATREIDWSPNLFRILGYDPDLTPVNEAAEAFDQAIHPDDLESYLEGQERALRGETQEPTKFRFVRPDGRTLHVVLVYAPVRDEQGEIQAFAGAILDVTRQAEAESEQLRTDRLETIGLLAGGVAHDFNNLLTIISGNAELLQLTDAGCAEAGHILDAVSLGASLTAQLLGFAQQTVERPHDIALDELVLATVPLVKRLLQENIEVGMELGAGESQVYVDPGLFQTALVNLAVNARDALPVGGRLCFRTWVEDAPDGGEAGEGREVVVLSTEDTGIGMDEATLQKIFEPFFTTKDGRQGPRGTGLGLASVRSFVLRAGGEIRARSEPEQGTSIELRFPRVHSVAAASAEVEESETLAAGEVLVVEDAAGVRRVLKTILQRAGLAPLVYASAQEALDAWPRHRQTVRTLVTDVVMPGMSGHLLAGELRRDRPDLGVVFITGYDPIGVDLERAVQLRKPFTRQQLMDALAEVSPARSNF